MWATLTRQTEEPALLAGQLIKLRGVSDGRDPVAFSRATASRLVRSGPAKTKRPARRALMAYNLDLAVQGPVTA